MELIKMVLLMKGRALNWQLDLVLAPNPDSVWSIFSF